MMTLILDGVWISILMGRREWSVGWVIKEEICYDLDVIAIINCC